MTECFKMDVFNLQNQHDLIEDLGLNIIKNRNFHIGLSQKNIQDPWNIPLFIVVLFIYNSMVIFCRHQTQMPPKKVTSAGRSFGCQEGLVRLATERYSLSPHSYGILWWMDSWDVLMAEICRENHLGWCWNPINNGINYQPQLVQDWNAINRIAFLFTTLWKQTIA